MIDKQHEKELDNTKQNVECSGSIRSSWTNQWNGRAVLTTSSFAIANRQSWRRGWRNVVTSFVRVTVRTRKSKKIASRKRLMTAWSWVHSKQVFHVPYVVRKRFSTMLYDSVARSHILSAVFKTGNAEISLEYRLCCDQSHSSSHNSMTHAYPFCTLQFLYSYLSLKDFASHWLQQTFQKYLRLHLIKKAD